MAAAVAVSVGAAGCGNDDPDAGPGGVVRLAAVTVPAAGPQLIVAPPQQQGVEVIVVGDSITVAAADAIRQRAGELGVTVLVDAEVDRRIEGGDTPEPGTVRVQTLRSTFAAPDLWVVALGTNDVPGYDSADDYERLIGGLLAEIPAGVPLIWVNVHVDGEDERSQRFNDRLVEVLSARGNARIADWDALADDDGMLSDGVHPSSGTGVPAFADLVVTSIAAWPL